MGRLGGPKREPYSEDEKRMQHSDVLFLFGFHSLRPYCTACFKTSKVRLITELFSPPFCRQLPVIQFLMVISCPHLKKEVWKEPYSFKGLVRMPTGGDQWHKRGLGSWGISDRCLLCQSCPPQWLHSSRGQNTPSMMGFALFGNHMNLCGEHLLCLFSLNF